MTKFTYSYQQPDAYHFCQDSVLAPPLIAQDLVTHFTGRQRLKALDVCAGSGVFAFELLHDLRAREKDDLIEQFDFLEIQNAFEPCFRANLEMVRVKEMKTSWINENYAVLQKPECCEAYDFIIANPPYFLRGEGSLSDNEISNRARFFLDDSLDSMLKGFRNALKPGGAAYFLMKSGKEHGRDAFTSARVQNFDCHFTRLADVRGTDLIKMAR